MKYIIFLITLLSILFKETSTLSVIITQISSMGYPDIDNKFPKCPSGYYYCVCDHCSVCLYERLSSGGYLFKTVQLASMPAGTDKEARFTPPTATKIVYTSNNAENLQIFASLCYYGGGSINLDVFFDTMIDTSFFINCKNCLGTYRGYKMSGTISISEMSLSPFRGIRADLSEIQFFSQKYSNNRCCYSSYKNTFDGCNICEFNLRMYVNSKSVSNENLDLLNSWDVDRKYSYPITVNTNNKQIVPLNLSFTLYQYYQSEQIDRSLNLRSNALPYSKTEFTVIGDYKRVKLVFKISSYSFNFNGGNSQYQQPNLAEGANMDLNGNVKCADPTLFGPLCNKEFSRCSSNNPCLNGGKCSGTPKTYKCDCPNGYNGKNCERFYCTNACINSRCVGANQCGTCYPGWTGNNCQEKTCDNYKNCKFGNCIISGNNRVCKCDGSATGSFCQFNCAFSCNNGDCAFSNGVNFCLCKPGWYGSVCNRQTVEEQRIFSTSTNFFVAIVLIIVIGIIIIIVTYFLMTKYFKTHVKSNVHEGDITQYRQTLQASNGILPIPNVQPQNFIPQEHDQKIYLAGSDYQATNFYNDKDIYTFDNKKTTADDAVYFNPYSDVQAQETYSYGLNNDMQSYAAVLTNKNNNKSTKTKKSREDNNNIYKDTESPYTDIAEKSNDIYKSDVATKSGKKTSNTNNYDDAYQNPYDN